MFFFSFCATVDQWNSMNFTKISDFALTQMYLEIILFGPGITKQWITHETQYNMNWSEWFQMYM